MEVSPSYEYSTAASENDQKRQLSSVLKKSELCICFPNWDNRHPSHEGLTLVKIMEEEQILDLIPLYIYELQTCRVEAHSKQDLMLKEKLMRSNHIIPFPRVVSVRRSKYVLENKNNGGDGMRWRIPSPPPLSH